MAEQARSLVRRCAGYTAMPYENDNQGTCQEKCYNTLTQCGEQVRLTSDGQCDCLLTRVTPTPATLLCEGALPPKQRHSQCPWPTTRIALNADAYYRTAFCRGKGSGSSDPSQCATNYILSFNSKACWDVSIRWRAAVVPATAEQMVNYMGENGPCNPERDLPNPNGDYGNGTDDKGVANAKPWADNFKVDTFPCENCAVTYHMDNCPMCCALIRSLTLLAYTSRERRRLARDHMSAAGSPAIT